MNLVFEHMDSVPTLWLLNASYFVWGLHGGTSDLFKCWRGNQLCWNYQKTVCLSIIGHLLRDFQRWFFFFMLDLCLFVLVGFRIWVPIGMWLHCASCKLLLKWGQWLGPIEHLLCTRDSALHFPGLSSRNPHTHPVGQVLALFCDKKNEGKSQNREGTY